MSDTMHPDHPAEGAMTDQQQQQPEPPANDSGQSPEVADAAPATRLTELASAHTSNPTEGRETVFALDDVTVSYNGVAAIRNVELNIHKNLVTAFIGPSGCGKTTLLRSFN